MLTINGNCICGGTNETIVEYIPFHKDNTDSFKSNKTESELDNCAIGNHVPAVYLTNFQIFNFVNMRREDMYSNSSEKSNLSNHNEENLPYTNSEPNENHLNISCPPNVTMKSIIDMDTFSKNIEPKLQQRTPTERNLTPGLIGIKHDWNMFTNSSTVKNDTHVLMPSTLENNNSCNNHSSVNIYTNETVNYVTTPSYNTHHSILGNKYAILTQRSSENLPDLRIDDRNIVDMVLTTTPKNHIEVTKKVTEIATNNQHIKPQNKSSKNCIFNHHTNRHFLIRFH